MKQRVTPVKKVRDDRENKVEVQKGPINANTPTMKFASVQHKATEDYEHHVLKRSGQTNHMRTPKK